MINRPKNAVAYLIFYIIASLLVFGGVFALMSDIRDLSAIPIFASISPMGTDLNDANTQWGFDFVNLCLSFSIIFFVIGLIFQAKQMAQKPEQPW